MLYVADDIIVWQSNVVKHENFKIYSTVHFHRQLNWLTVFTMCTFVQNVLNTCASVYLTIVYKLFVMRCWVSSGSRPSAHVHVACVRVSVQCVCMWHIMISKCGHPHATSLSFDPNLFIAIFTNNITSFIFTFWREIQSVAQ